MTSRFAAFRSAALLWVAAAAEALALPTPAAAQTASQAASQPAAATAPYRSIELRTPQPGETLHDNEGVVAVEVALEPPLQADAGHRLQIAIDGRALAIPHPHAPRFVLRGIERGEHTLRVGVVGADGTELIATPPVWFHVWQASRRFPNRRGP